MERSRNIILLIFILFYINVSALANNQEIIYKAYIKNDMVLWKHTIDEMIDTKPKTQSFTLELVNYMYGYIAWSIGNNNKKEASRYIDISENYLNILENQKYKLSEIKAYKSAIYGFKIGLNMFIAPYIGPRSIEYSKQSMKIDKLNPTGYIQYANAYYYMPVVFGGSKSIALDYYLKAKILMEESDKFNNNNWNYLNLLTIIANAYNETKQYQLADFYYKKILTLEPHYLWVKNELYPQFEKEFRQTKN
jgi:hypothetical protein